jgi:hypothetical protein
MEEEIRSHKRGIVYVFGSPLPKITKLISFESLKKIQGMNNEI